MPSTELSQSGSRAPRVYIVHAAEDGEYARLVAKALSRCGADCDFPDTVQHQSIRWHQEHLKGRDALIVCWYNASEAWVLSQMLRSVKGGETRPFMALVMGAWRNWGKIFAQSQLPEPDLVINLTIQALILRGQRLAHGPHDDDVQEPLQPLVSAIMKRKTRAVALESPPMQDTSQRTFLKSRCLLCESDGRSFTCSFHPGNRSFWHSSGDDRDDPYRDAYVWSCCGRIAFSTLANTDDLRELRPVRSAGCASAERHLFAARVALVFSLEFAGLAEETVGMLAQNGIRTELLHYESFDQQPVHDCDLIVILHDSDERTLVKRLGTQFLANAEKNIVIFSSPEKLNTYEVEVQSTHGLAAHTIFEAVRQALRKPHRPINEWQPDVFVSYTRSNRKLATAYSAAITLRMWIDTRMLAPGVRWSTEILSGIQKSSLFFLIITPDTPEPTYCWLELADAIKSEKPIFVVCHGDTEGRLLQATGTTVSEWEQVRMKDPYETGDLLLRRAFVNKSSVTLLPPCQFVNPSCDDEEAWLGVNHYALVVGSILARELRRNLKEFPTKS